MTFTLKRSGTIGDLVPPLRDAAAGLHAALDGLRLAADAQADAILAAKVAIKPFATGSLGVQLDASAQAVASLQAMITTPTVYVDSLISGAVAAQANLAVELPTAMLEAQLNAAMSVNASVSLELGAANASLELLVTASAALKAAVAAVGPALAAYVAVSAHLEVGTANLYRFDGDLAAFGLEADAGIALSGSARVATIVTQDLSAKASLSVVFDL